MTVVGILFLISRIELDANWMSLLPPLIVTGPGWALPSRR